MTIDDLKTIMLQCTGIDDALALDGDFSALPFRELGYDSLAVLQIASQVQRQFQIDVPDEAIETMATPGDVIAFVTSVRAAA